MILRLGVAPRRDTSAVGRTFGLRSKPLAVGRVNVMSGYLDGLNRKRRYSLHHNCIVDVSGRLPSPLYSIQVVSALRCSSYVGSSFLG